MKTKQSRIHSLLFALLVSGASFVASSHVAAESFPFSALPAQAKAVEDAPSQNAGVLADDIDASNFQFLHGVALTQEQRSAYASILQSQMAAISSNITTLENSRALLREMALSKFYDDTLADIAANRIAKSTAALAVLQAEREYKVFALLTTEQASVFRK